MAVWEILWFFETSSWAFCMFTWWVAVTGLPDYGWFFRLTFPLLLLYILLNNTQYLCPQYIHHSNNCRWILMEVSFSWLKNSITACSLKLFDSWERDLRFEQNTAHSSTNWIPRNSEQFGISTASRSHHLCEIHAQRHYFRNTFVLPTMRISKFLWIWLAVSNDLIIILLP